MDDVHSMVSTAHSIAPIISSNNQWIVHIKEHVQSMDLGIVNYPYINITLEIIKYTYM